jgi:hypothetical protein
MNVHASRVAAWILGRELGNELAALERLVDAQTSG